jgi:hypothetical protein
MARFVAFDAIFFLLPFAIYGAWLIFTRGTAKNLADWQVRTIAYLAIAGSLFLFTTILILTSTGDDHQAGVYVPAHVDNGVIVPAHVEPIPGKPTTPVP